jgi:hypothetical protein
MTEEVKKVEVKEVKKDEVMGSFEDDNAFLGDAVAEEVSSELPEMPSDETLAAWKKAYGRIYAVDIVDTEYIYRGISRPEVKAITEDATKEITVMRRKNPMMAQEDQADFMVDYMRDAEVRLCVLWPDLSRTDFDDPTSQESLAGVIPALGDAIEEASGFGMKAIPREL